MKTILVTGGAGFIGSNFIKYMLDKYAEYKIINLDILTYAANLDYLKDISDDKNYLFIKGDITNRSLVKRIFSEYDISYVINFAAESHVDRSINNPDVFVQTNILGTQVLLDVAKTYWIDHLDKVYIEDTKFLQVSTDEVYGTLGETGEFTEETPLMPNSPYSASKASADMLVRAYHKTFGLPVNITRCSNNYGPHQHEEKLIPLMIKKCLLEQSLPVYGDGMQVRDWLHVADHCKAIDLVLHNGVNGEVYNVGGSNEKTNLELVKTIIDELDKSHSLIEHVTDRPGHDRRYAIDHSKISNELGWYPELDFQQGINDTIAWFKKTMIRE